MINVLFVCRGNICRSPMAELILTDLAEKEGVAGKMGIMSCGTSDEEAGNGIYAPAMRVLLNHGIVGGHIAQPITYALACGCDHILVAEERNRAEVLRRLDGEFGDRIFRICDFTSNPRDIADPWYTGDFERAYRDIYDGCKAYLEYIKRERYI